VNCPQCNYDGFEERVNDNLTPMKICRQCGLRNEAGSDKWFDGDKEFIPTPMCDKLAKMDTQRLVLHEFLEWLDQQKISLAGYEGHTMYPITKSHEEIVFKFLGIDERVLESERKKLMESIR